MSIRSTVTSGTWQELGTGPATVQVISPDANGVTVMVIAAASAPGTNNDGLALNAEYPVHNFNSAQNIYAQVAQAGLTALVAFQGETT